MPLKPVPPQQSVMADVHVPAASSQSPALISAPASQQDVMTPSSAACELYPVLMEDIV